jgi:hypothetical protein
MAARLTGLLKNLFATAQDSSHEAAALGVSPTGLEVTPNAAIDRRSTAARSAAVEGPCRIACWASIQTPLDPLKVTHFNVAQALETLCRATA